MTARRDDSSGRCWRGPVPDQCPRRGTQGGTNPPPALSWATTVAAPPHTLYFDDTQTLTRGTSLSPWAAYQRSCSAARYSHSHSTAANHRPCPAAPHRFCLPAAHKSRPSAPRRSCPAAAYKCCPAAPLCELASPSPPRSCRHVVAVATPVVVVTGRRRLACPHRGHLRFLRSRGAALLWSHFFFSGRRQGTAAPPPCHTAVIFLKVPPRLTWQPCSSAGRRRAIVGACGA